MSIDTLLVVTAWRLRAHLGASADSTHASDEEAIAALIESEHRAARHQLPMFAASRYSRCAHTDPSGSRCQFLAVTAPVYGWLCRNPQVPVIYQDACWPFIGALCARHVGHLIVPPAAWWPASEVAVEADQEAMWYAAV